MITRNINYYGNDAYRNENVIAHEFGHAVGLNHNDTTFNCPDGGRDYDSIMYYSDIRVNGTCSAYYPKPDDVSGIDGLY